MTFPFARYVSKHSTLVYKHLITNDLCCDAYTRSTYMRICATLMHMPFVC